MCGKFVSFSLRSRKILSALEFCRRVRRYPPQAPQSARDRASRRLLHLFGKGLGSAQGFASVGLGLGQKRIRLGDVICCADLDHPSARGRATGRARSPPLCCPRARFVSRRKAANLSIVGSDGFRCLLGRAAAPATQRIADGVAADARASAACVVDPSSAAPFDRAPCRALRSWPPACRRRQRRKAAAQRARDGGWPRFFDRHFWARSRRRGRVDRRLAFSARSPTERAFGLDRLGAPALGST